MPKRKLPRRAKPAGWKPIATAPGAYLPQGEARGAGKEEAQRTLRDLDARLAAAKAKMPGGEKG